MTGEELARLRAQVEHIREMARLQEIATTAQIDQLRAGHRDALHRMWASMQRADEILGTAHPATRRLRGRAAWITAAIIDTLDAEAPLPASTPTLAARLCLTSNSEYATVLRLLNRLHQLGEAEKWPAGENRWCAWRRLGGPQDE